MSFLVAVLFRGVAVSFVGLAGVALLRRALAATRAAVCGVTLLAMVALPLGMVALPKRTVAVEGLPSQVPDTAEFRATAPSVPMRAPKAEDEPPVFDSVPLVLGIWLLGAVVVAGRTLAGWIVVLGWVRRSRSLGEKHHHPTLPPGGGVPDCKVLVSDEVAQPCATWAGRGVVLLPADHEGWSEERRRAVLLHEAAHLARRDLLWAFLGRLALALHWPNPFVWTLARAARRAAEEAADDAVLCAGLAPTDYADHLLELARRPSFALALPMASRPEVHRRILNVLNPSRTRGRVRPLALALATLLLAGVFTTAVCLVQDDGRRPLIRPEATGQSQAGNAANGFVGRTSDGRPVAMLQIVRQTPKGIVAWRPNGTPIPESRRIDVPLAQHNRKLMTVLLRFPGRVADAWNEAEPSSHHVPGDSDQVLLALGGDLPGRRPGEQATYNFLGLMVSGVRQDSFVCPLNDGPWTTEAIVPVKVGQWGDSGRLREVSIATSGGTWARPVDATDSPNYHESWTQTDVRFVLLGGTGARCIRATATLKDGTQASPDWSGDAEGRLTDGAFRLVSFRHPPSEIARIEIATRAVQRIEFDGVRLRPNER